MFCGEQYGLDTIYCPPHKYFTQEILQVTVNFQNFNEKAAQSIFGVFFIHPVFCALYILS